MSKGIFSIILVVCFLTASQSYGKPVKAEKGVLDLRVMDSLEMVTLDGEWVFVWQKFLSPDDTLEKIKGSVYCNIPSYWTSCKNENTKITKHGFGTYYLEIILPEISPSHLSLDIPVFDASSTVFINGEQSLLQGICGRTPETTTPGYKPGMINFHKSSDTLRIMVHVSNFHHRNGGFWKSMKLGPIKEMRAKADQNKLINYSLLGILFGTFLLFLVFYIIDRYNLTFLAFAFTTLGFLLRILNSGEYPLHTFVDQNWNLTIKLEYIGLILATGFGPFYLNRLMPTKGLEKILRFLLYACAGLTLLIVLAPPRIFSYTVYIPELVGIVTLLFFIGKSFSGLLKGKAQETAFFISVLILFAALINDILHANSRGSLSSVYLTSIAFLALIIIQVYILLRDWSNNYHERIRMNDELINLNQNLESIVNERTKKLNEINANLEQTLATQKRVFSIIAHDLKSPMANLAQYSDLLLSEFKGTPRNELVIEFHRATHGAIHLIDNLLFWGGRQGRKINYDPQSFSLLAVSKEIASLYKDQLSSKRIRFKASVPPDLHVYCDKNLLMIILRNLMNNAVKFTPQHGIIELIGGEIKEQIHISLKDSGVGMTSEQIKNVLNKEPASTKGTAGEKGTGLGLLVVEELVQINKGQFTIESKPGKGTTMLFTLPGKP